MPGVTRGIQLAGMTAAALVCAASPRLPRPGTKLHAWVFFKDKGPEVAAALRGDPPSALTPRALARRARRRTAPGLFDERDLPPSPAHLAAVQATGARVRTTSRWLNAVTVEAESAQLHGLAQLACVRAVRSVRRSRPLHHAGPESGATPPSTRGFYGAAEGQVRQIGLSPLHAAGYTGKGVLVGVLDTGFRRQHAAFNHRDHPLRVVAEYDFLDDDPVTAPEAGDPRAQHEHGTWVLGVLAAHAPGVFVGGAYDAGYLLAKVEEEAAEYPGEEDLFVAGLEFVEAQGADVVSSSVVLYGHYRQSQLDGGTSVMTVALNTATENGVHCFEGAGNLGHDDDPHTSRLVPPADAVDVLTVGAVDEDDGIAPFSSDGPTADGRQKPELLARGDPTWTVDAHDDSRVVALEGTSLATPLAAAAAACLVQAHPEWSVADMRQALLRTAQAPALTARPDPLFVGGYGIIDAWAAAGRSVFPAPAGSR
jgi:subtilisin family serine protease